MTAPENDTETADERAAYLAVIEHKRAERDDYLRRHRYLSALAAHWWLRILERAW